MIYNKEICQELTRRKATIAVQDGVKEDGTPNIVKRIVTKAFGSRSGRGDSYWGVQFNEPIENGCTGVCFKFIKGYEYLIPNKSFKYKNWFCEWEKVEQEYHLYTPEEMEQPKGFREYESAVSTKGQAKKFIDNY